MLLRDLSPASFRGIRFYVPKDSLDEGRRTIDHQWVDSNRRYAEDNGFIPPEFKLNIILTGQNLPGQVAALRAALNAPGPGTLKHPWAGVHRCSVKGPHKIEREDTDSGVVKIEACFLRDDGPVFMAVLSGIPAVVAGLAASVTSSAVSVFPTSYGAGTTTLASRTAIGVQIANIGRALEDLSGLGREVRTIINAADTLADEPERLAGLIGDAVRLPFADIESYPVTNVVQGMRTLSDAAAAVVTEAQTYAVRIERL